MSDPVKPVPEDVLLGRLNRMRDWARAEGLAALVVFGQGSALGNASRSHGNLRFLLDWDADAAPSALVLPIEGKPSLAVANIFAALRAEEHPLLEQVRFGKGSSFADAVLDLIPRGASRIGIAGRDEVPVSVWSSLVSRGAGDWTSCEPELGRMRALKDEIQLAYHRQAAKICDRLFEELGPALRSGLPVWRIQTKLETLGRELGCEHCDTWLTVRPIADRCRYVPVENTNLPQEGDQALLGIMLMYQGHWGHAIRTGSIGKPSAAAQRTYDIVDELHAAMLAELHPGADLRAVGAAGIYKGDELGPCFQFRSGHALGHSYEDPIGSSEFPQPYDKTVALPPEPRPAQAGMLFEFHPNVFIENYAGASIGDMVLLTENGPELMTQYPRRLLAF